MLGNNKSNPYKQAFFVGVLTFFLAVFISFTSDLFVRKSSSIIISFILLLIIILIGIIFDMVGTASTAANEEPFHAKASKKVRGAKQAIKLIRNADKVANFCNDVVGDICGTISGALGAAIVLQIVTSGSATNEVLFSMLMTGFVAATTVGGKAFGKKTAIEQSEHIIFQVGRFLEWIEALKVKKGKVGKQREKVRKP